MDSRGGRPLADLIDGGRLSLYQALIIALCGLVAMLDGFDTQAIAFVIPAIARQWALVPSAFGPAFAAGLFGGLLGALGFGAIADRFGRRLTILITVSLFAVTSLATLFAASLPQLIIFRFVTGVGLGGAMPSIIALSSEYSPKSLRNTLVTAMFCGFPLGAVVGALATARLLASSGWPIVFILGGVAPLLILPALIAIIPDSPSWLSRRRKGERIAKILASMGVSSQWDGSMSCDQDGVPEPGPGQLFAAGRTGGTLLLWLVFFLSLLLVYLLVSWIPTIAVNRGQSVNGGSLAAALLNMTGIAGSLCIGRLGDRFSAFLAVGAAYCLGALGIVCSSLWSGADIGIFLFSAVAGFFCIGAQMCAVALASNFYPVEIRGTGVGAAMGVGRLGAIAGPLLGGMFLGDGGFANLLILLAALSLLAGLGVFAIGKLSK